MTVQQHKRLKKSEDKQKSERIYKENGLSWVSNKRIQKPILPQGNMLPPILPTGIQVPPSPILPKR